MKIEQIVGKTIKSVEIERNEASDGCRYGSLVLEFTDGSTYSMLMTPSLRVNGIFFRDENDHKDEHEVKLIKP